MWGTKMDKTAICEYLDRIIGEPVSCIGRVTNMVWIGIGKNVMTVNRKGRETEKTEYALHIQSAWRIINKKKEEIVMTSSDMYSPRTGMGYSENFDWEPQGNNLFDEKSQNWQKREIPIYIKKYKINRWGDLTLFFQTMKNCRYLMSRPIIQKVIERVGGYSNLEAKNCTWL